MAIYKGRSPGTWRVVVWAKNRSHERIVEGKKSDAEAYEAKLRLELAAQRKVATRTAPSFSSFCASHYRPHAERHLGNRTWRTVRIYQVATLESFFGEMKLTEISTEEVESYKRVRLKDVGPSSVNNELRVLRTILNWAKACGFPIPDIVVKKLPTHSGRVRVWSTDQCHRMYASAHTVDDMLERMLVFLVNTGCRKGEAIVAEWSWVDRNGQMLRIPVNEFWHPKSGRPREIPIGTALERLLAGAPAHPTWLFPNQLGARYAQFPKDLFWRARDAAGLEGGVHTTRHTYASHFLSTTPDLFLLAQVLGHSHQRVTELYSHLLPEHLKRARNAVNLLPKTMARAMAKPTRKPKTPQKTALRH